MAFNRSSHRQNVAIILSSMGFLLWGMKWCFTLNLEEEAHGFNKWQLGLDNNTGLIWERKTSGSGIHNVNQRYSWSTNDSDPNGTAFTVFLATLNNTCAGNETTACTTNADCTGIGKGQCGYAGHRDWRMPNLKELQSLVDYSVDYSKPSPGPAIASSFPGATAANYYYCSSTTLAGHSLHVWVVNFSAGFVTAVGKSMPCHVRA